MKTCECCGHPLPDDSVLGALTPLQKRVFRAIQRAGKAGIPGPELMSIVYADDPTGGPSSANIIAVVARQMKPRLAPFGLTLKGRLGAGGYYTLETIGGENAAQ